jgi:hypothetical protein
VLLIAIRAIVFAILFGGAVMPRTTATILLGLVSLFITSLANADERTQHTISRGDIADRLNREQLSWPGTPSAEPMRERMATESVGILFLRGDGGDPKELRVGADDNLIFIVQQNGEGRAYQNGREIDIDPAVKESARQIAVTQFGAPGAQLPQPALSVAAQAALRRFMASGVKPHVMFTHTASRDDTAKVSDQRAAKIVALEESRGTVRLNDTVGLVRMAMRTFGLKSDACDNSFDPRCDRPGVREAFAQIKHEEAFRRASAPR